MLEIFSPGRSLAWDMVWQSSFFLALGIAASLVFRSHPARAHRVLLLTMIAALGTPLVAQAIRHRGWGLLRQTGVVIKTAHLTAPTDLQIGPEERDRGWSGPRAARDIPWATDSGQVDPRRVSQAAVTAVQPRGESAMSRPVIPLALATSLSWRQFLVACWWLLSMLAILRFAVGLVRGLRLVRISFLVADSALDAAVSRAVSRLGLAVHPEMRSSFFIRCPSVWCWGRRPILLVPTGAKTADASIDWTAVFCHELAHWRRLDHLASLTGEILSCVLPWSPLVWWSRKRLGQFAELACDDWALASGAEGTDYAASLLGLVPQRGPALALAAVSGSGLADRLKHILDDRRSSPRLGWRWACLSGFVMMLAVFAIALAQAGQAALASKRVESESNGAAPASNSRSDNADATRHTVHGQVLAPDGKPARDATVLWVGTRRPTVPYVALPKDDDQSRNPRIETLAKSQTDRQGRFQITASFGRDELIRFNGIESQVVVIAPGAGMASKELDKNLGQMDVTIRLGAERLIHGRLLTPAGQPAKGVRVVLNGFYDEREKTGMYVGFQDDDAKLPPYWPKPVLTGADGRFTLEGVPRCPQVTLSFWHRDYAVDEVVVDTTETGVITPSMKGFEIVPVKPEFTHALEPAKPVQGRVTDKATGKPLAGMLVEMIPMRRHGGMPFFGRTDSNGNYRISGHATDGTYFTTVFPPADSGYLDAKDVHQGWPAGARFLKVDFALQKGRLVSGRVIDQASKQPVSGAAVVYQPARRNPNNNDRHDLRNTVLTDKDGRFTITTLTGEGFLAVEAPDVNYIRSPLKRYRTLYPHGQLAIDVPKDGTPPPVEIALRKGVTLEAKAVAPDGQVVKDVTAMYPGIDARLIDIWNQGQQFSDGIVRIEGADPERTYRVFFIKPDQRLGTVADLKFDPHKPGPIELKLQPTATIRGKVVNPDGSPAKSGQVTPFIGLGAEKEEVTRDAMYNGEKLQFYSNILGQRNFYFHKDEPGSEGDFVFEAMVPGAWYSISATTAGRVATITTPVLKPGEVYDAGKLAVKEEQR